MPGPMYRRAESMEEAVSLLDSLGDDAHVIAGGQSLMTLMNMGLAEPAVLVDIDRIPGWSYLRRDGDALRVGALTRHADVERCEDDLGGFAVLPAAARGLAYPAIRERGTFAGVLAHADPTGEWCSLVQALDGEIHASGPTGPRHVSATDLFDGPFMTSLSPIEVITEVVLPHEFDHAHLRKIEPLHPDFQALVVAAAFDRSGGTIERARIAVGGSGGTARRVPDAEAQLDGADASPEAFAEAAHVAAATIEVRASDASAERYCRRVVNSLVRRALEGA